MLCAWRGALAGQRARLVELRRHWLAQVPAVVLTSDPRDLDALAEHTTRPLTVARV